MEFFDLREVQDTILAKSLWPRFEGVFVNKESLAHKFDQLAELRNGIRHSRTVSEVTRMDGEASMLWFAKVMATAYQVPAFQISGGPKWVDSDRFDIEA